METRLTIKNFRVFDEKGATIDLKPITILTGANSSGKSTVVKADFLLNSFLSQIKKAIENGNPIELDKYKLDFTSYPNNLLGRFDKVVHDGSKTNTITIEYTTYSLMLSKDVSVQLVFSPDENDELNNAYLESIKMSTNEGVFYFSGKGETSYCNLNIIKEDFITFLLTEFAAHNYCGAWSAYDLEGKISKEEFDETSKLTVEFLQTVDKTRRADILKYVRTCKRNNSLIHETGADPSVIEHMQGKQSIFAIPVIDKLASMPKSEVKAFVTSEFLRDASVDVVFATNKVVDAFLASEFDNFVDFFTDFEISSFSKRACGSRNTFGGFKNGVRLINAHDLTLRQDYLTHNPHNLRGDILVFCDDDEVTVINEDDPNQRAEKQAEIQAWENREISFEMLYEVVMKWNKKFALDGKGVYVYTEPSRDDPWGSYYHIAFRLLTKFTEALMQEVACPNWCGNMSYVSSARASVNRLYSLDNKDDFSMLLRNYFEKKRNYLKYQENKRDYEVNSFMNRWIEKFEIGKVISLDVDKEGLGVQIRLHKTEDDEGRILADEGYGITQLVSILLQIETAILSAQGEKVNKLWKLDTFDHYDINQFHYEVNTIAIEEPEIHLHPKFQSLLIEMFLEAFEIYNIHFIIETHSEYLIRKLQGIIARGELSSEKLSTFYVNDPDPLKRPKEEPQIKNIGIRKDGRLSSSFGPGFFDEADNLSDEIFEAQSQHS